MLWIKAFHLIFVVTWFAGLFYLPRLFVYHTSLHDDTTHALFCTMERRLFGIMTLGAALAIGFGLALLFLRPGLLAAPWIHAKLALVGALIAYHFWLGRLMKAFANGHNKHSERFYRWINEAPALLLVIVVCLAILKPSGA